MLNRQVETRDIRSVRMPLPRMDRDHRIPQNAQSALGTSQTTPQAHQNEKHFP
jgi:hypothetical protein